MSTKAGVWCLAAVLLLFPGVGVLHAQLERRLPKDLASLTSDNAGQLVYLDTLKEGILLHSGLIDGGRSLVTVSTTSVQVYDTANLSAPPRRIPYAADLFGQFRTASVIRGTVVGFGETELWINFDDQTLIVDLATGSQRFVSPASGMHIRAASPDARWQALTPLDNRVFELFLADTATGEMKSVLPPEGTGVIRQVVFTPDGRHLVFVGRGAEVQFKLYVVDVAQGELVAQREIEEPEASVAVSNTAVALYPEDAEGATAEIYTLPNLSPRNTVDGVAEPVALSRDGALLAHFQPDMDYDHYLVRDAATGEERARIQTERCRRDFSSLFFSPDASTLYLERPLRGGMVTAWDVSSGAPRGAVGGYGLYLTGITFSPDGQTLVTSSYDFDPHPCAANNPGNGVRFYDAQTGVLSSFLPITTGAIEGLAVGGDGLVATTGPRQIVVWRNGEPDASINHPDFGLYIQDIAFSGDNRYLAAISEGRVFVWAVDALEVGAEVANLPNVEDTRGKNLLAVNEALFYHRGTTVYRYDLVTGDESEFFTAPAVVSGLDYNAVTNRLAVNTSGLIPPPEGSEPSLTLLGLHADPSPPLTFPVLRERPFVAFSADGSLVAVTLPDGDYSFPGTPIYDTTSGAQVGGVDRMAAPVAFRPDGRMLFGTATTLEAYGVPGN